MDNMWINPWYYYPYYPAYPYGYTYYTWPTTQSGWQCPKCLKVYAPSVSVCVCSIAKSENEAANETV
jgi:hypothetical protein